MNKKNEDIVDNFNIGDKVSYLIKTIYHGISIIKGIITKIENKKAQLNNRNWVSLYRLKKRMNKEDSHK